MNRIKITFNTNTHSTAQLPLDFDCLIREKNETLVSFMLLTRSKIDWFLSWLQKSVLDYINKRRRLFGCLAVRSVSGFVQFNFMKRLRLKHRRIERRLNKFPDFSLLFSFHFDYTPSSEPNRSQWQRK